MDGVQVMHINFLSMLATLLLFLGASCGCVASDEQQKDLDVLLQKSFDQIYFAIGGLEYPYSVKQLNNCVKHEDKACLDVYNLVLEGKKTIKTVASMRSLETTLDIIERVCPSKDDDLGGAICNGGILSLYFYTTPEQDAKILNRIKIYPKQLKNIIFHRDFYWARNRPDKAAWISAVSTMDVDWRNDIHKKRTLALFRKSIAELKDETFIAK